MSRRSDSQGILGAFMYLAFGLMVYVVLFEPESGFSWADPWVYIVAAFWPLALIYKFTVAIVLLALIAVAVVAVYRTFAGKRDRRRGPTPFDES